MTSLLKSLLNQYRISIITTVSVFAIYSLVGFYLIPWALKSFLTHNIAEKYQRTVTVGDVRFNPYRLALTIDELTILDIDNTPLLGIGQLLIDYNGFSPFRLEYGLDSFHILRPYVKLETDGKGSYLLVNTFATAPATPEPVADDVPGDIPSVMIKSFILDDGAIDYIDRHRTTPFIRHLAPIHFTLSEFHTRKPQYGNQLALEIADTDAGSMRWSGDVRLNPLHSTGQLTLKNIGLVPLFQFAVPAPTFHLQSARLDVQADYTFEQGKEIALHIHKGDIALRNVALSKHANEPAVIDLPLIHLSELSVDLQKQTVTIGKIALNDGTLNMVLDKSGQSNIQQLFAADPATVSATSTAPPAPSAAATPTPTVAPWNVLIENFTLANYTVQMRDEKLATPFVMALAPIAISAQGIKLLTSDPFTAHVSIGLPAAGEIVTDATVSLAPTKAQGTLQLKQLSLPVIQPYIDDQIRAVLKQGQLNAALNFTMASEEKMQLDVSGEINIKQLEINEKESARKLLSWDELALQGINYSMGNNTLLTEKITLNKPYARFIINDDGTTNIQQLLNQKTTVTENTAVPVGSSALVAPVPTTAPATASTAPPLDINISMLEIIDGDMGFADLSLEPDFRVGIERMNGTIKGMSSKPSAQAKVDIRGKVDRYAPVTIAGTINPFASPAALNMNVAFKNIELTTFTPYSGTYGGFVIQKGQLSLELGYNLVNNRINGKNRIVMNQLQLGENVKSPRAIDLPIRLAIALLRDENGVIDLGFEVKGNVDEPEFSIGGLIFKVLGNMIKKAVLAPFTMIAGMFGGPEDMDQVVFQPGSTQLDDTALQKLEAVSTTLNKRNMLQINIQGNALPDQDRTALQQQKLLQQLAADNDIPATTFLSPAAAVEDGSARRKVNNWYEKQRAEDIGDLEDRIVEEQRIKGQTLDRAALKVSVYEHAWNRLVDGTAFNDSELQQLALQRAQNIKATLVDKHQIAPERIFVLEANPDASKASLTTILTLDAH